jgi:hypothetical protein
MAVESPSASSRAQSFDFLDAENWPQPMATLARPINVSGQDSKMPKVKHGPIQAICIGGRATGRRQDVTMQSPYYVFVAVQSDHRPRSNARRAAAIYIDGLVNMIGARHQTPWLLVFSLRQSVPASNFCRQGTSIANVSTWNPNKYGNCPCLSPSLRAN